MRIYRMEATFGKLEREVLTLEPGLNILQGSNEWGKSTWCAFLLAMLYGLDTRAKTTKHALADKERFAPWSGSPMAGRIDLNWKGRDITIERTTKGRIPMGVFRAYETESGLAVPELTAANCGQLLLGVEQSVFRRSGFIRLSDLPVTQDEALRRRLNALVTTGDESGDAERLERSLRELKNRCRYNKTGLLPQAETEREALAEKLEELEALELHCRKLKQRLCEGRDWQRQLENHRTALRYADAEADATRVAQARDAYDQAERRLAELESSCAKLPEQALAQKKLRELREFQEQWDAAQMELQLLPGEPEPPEPPAAFAGMSVERAQQMLRDDMAQYEQLRGKPAGLVCAIGGALCLLLAVLTAVWGEYLIMGALLAAGMILLALGLRSRRAKRRQLAQLKEKYRAPRPEDWQEALESFRRAMEDHSRALLEHRMSRGDLDQRLAALKTRRQSLCGEQSAEKVLQLWQQVLQRWEEYRTALREAQQAERHFHTLQAMAKPARRPDAADSLQYTEQETTRLLSEALAEQQRLQGRLGQYQGRMEALGQREVLQQQLYRTGQRIQKLEDTYAAASLALDTLAQAKRELQRRFAPRISRRAQELLGKLTRGRYDRLTLNEDLSLHAGAEGEQTLREAYWRSDGTADQLYLALRLAVAEELTPEVPLILDDALVRFDDRRLEAALEVLGELAEKRQVILFTCQSREKRVYETIKERAQ